MKTFHNSCIMSPGSYTLNKDNVENLRQNSRILSSASFKDRPMNTNRRSKTYICKDEAAIYIEDLIYPN